MKIIVVTGKSGSGKTYVSNILANILNAKHLNLDQISHQTLTLPNVKTFILENFGKEVFYNGEVDRKKLGAISFNNVEKLNNLNKLCEVEMVKIIDMEIKVCNTNFLILDYLLLPLMKYFNMADIKILTKSNKQTRTERIIKRDNITKKYFELRDKNSIEFDEKNYDYVVDSTNTEMLEKIANKIKADN